MHDRLRCSITSRLVHASLLCLGLVIASVSSASSDQAATLTDAISRAYNSKQISALVAAAAGRVETGADLQSPSFAPLQQTLEVSDSVAVALLRVLDRSGTPPDGLANSLAESAIQYHAVLDSLAEMNVYDPIASQPVMRAQAATRTTNSLPLADRAATAQWSMSTGSWPHRCGHCWARSH